MKKRDQMYVNYEVTSPCRGIVERVLCQESSYVHEGETLFVIRTNEKLVHVTVDFNGSVKGIGVQPGDEVINGMILANIQEDIFKILMGSD